MFLFDVASCSRLTLAGN